MKAAAHGGLEKKKKGKRKGWRGRRQEGEEKQIKRDASKHESVHTCENTAMQTDPVYGRGAGGNGPSDSGASNFIFVLFFDSFFLQEMRKGELNSF